jgi:hypothetical protein
MRSVGRRLQIEHRRRNDELLARSGQGESLPLQPKTCTRARRREAAVAADREASAADIGLPREEDALGGRGACSQIAGCGSGEVQAAIGPCG